MTRRVFHVPPLLFREKYIQPPTSFSEPWGPEWPRKKVLLLFFSVPGALMGNLILRLDKSLGKYAKEKERGGGGEGFLILHASKQGRKTMASSDRS